MSDKHSKHVKLSKASVGDFARNELGIVGPNCDEIKKLAQQWATALGHRFKSVYVDQDHAYLDLPCTEQLENSTIAKAKHLTGKHWERLEQNLHPSYSEKALDYDLAFLNGNHFLATSSILIYQTSRHNKLIKKDLSTVTCVVSSYKDKEQALGLTSANCQWIDMDDEMGIPRFIELTFPKPKLNALILSGGKSTRMGTDKGALNYHGEPQRVHLEQLLEKHVHGVYHSVRSEQGLNLDNKIEDR
ncbi:MAG: NTP transferase domain-containing protein, partial [Flavobacteriales bacterium]